nr:immunoglobulin heavy chain junction region [Macaca mulatta]
CARAGDSQFDFW